MVNYPTFHFPAPRPLYPNGPPQVDFSKIAAIADSYYRSRDAKEKRAREAQEREERTADRAETRAYRAESLLPSSAREYKYYRQEEGAAGRKPVGYRDFLNSRAMHSGQTERIIANLMEDNPGLSYADAVALARRAPQDDTLRRERLAHDAYRNDPSRELEEWRQFYGLGAPAAPAMPSAPPAPAASALPPSIGQDRTSQFAAPGLGSASPPPAQGADQARQAREAARRAIVQGADRNAVIRRLRAMGVDPTGL